MRAALGEGVRESTRVRVGAIAVFLFVGLVASISSFVATDEFLTLEFFAFLFGNLASCSYSRERLPERSSVDGDQSGGRNRGRR